MRNPKQGWTVSISWFFQPLPSFLRLFLCLLVIFFSKKHASSGQRQEEIGEVLMWACSIRRFWSWVYLLKDILQDASHAKIWFNYSDTGKCFWTIQKTNANKGNVGKWWESDQNLIIVECWGSGSRKCSWGWNGEQRLVFFHQRRIQIFETVSSFQYQKEVFN